MDRVKLGRALGYGTRHAARTVAAVVEAAATPSASPSGRPGAPAPPASTTPQAPSTAGMPPARARRSSYAPEGNLRGRARAVWQPLAVFSGALWLRVTGVFFALIASTLGSGAWRLRGALHGGAAAAPHRFWLFLGFGLLFAYFAASSFVRASLKERRAARR